MVSVVDGGRAGELECGNVTVYLYGYGHIVRFPIRSFAPILWPSKMWPRFPQ